jgi:hypothetical protein
MQRQNVVLTFLSLFQGKAKQYKLLSNLKKLNLYEFSVYIMTRKARQVCDTADNCFQGITPKDLVRFSLYFL